MNFPSLLFNKEKLCQSIYLYEIDALIRTKLSPENLKILDGDIGLRELMFTHYGNNRFFTSLPEERVLESVSNCIDTYKFLLDSGLETERIRSAFMKALMDVMSLGSGTYFVLWDAGYNRHWFLARMPNPCNKGNGSIFSPKRHKYGRIFRCAWGKIIGIMEQKYPLIPDSTWFSEDVFRGIGVKKTENRYPFSRQLSVSFSYPLFLLRIRRKINIAALEEEFFIKHRGCLERLSSCNEIFLNKYREEMCREIAHDLGLDPDPSYFRGGYFQNNPTPLSRNLDFLSDVAASVIRCFSAAELELFREIDAERNDWSFSDQIRDRYCSKYPSFAPFPEIEECIVKAVSEYRALLNEETAEAIREIMFDEIEGVVFISRPTHLGNLEMKENLRRGRTGASRKVTKAVDLLLSLFPEESIEALSTEIDGRKYGLKEQLLARWNRAWLAANIKAFKNYLDQMHPHTPVNKPVVSWIDLQSLLGKMDGFFLYPNRGRCIKKIFRRLDTGRSVGMLEKFRANSSYEANMDPVFVLRHLLFYLFIFSMLAVVCSILI